MNIIQRAVTRVTKALNYVGSSRWRHRSILESFPGAWQQNVEVKLEDSLQYWAVFRCISLISSDIAKLNLRLVEKDSDGIWNEVDVPAFSPVLRKPNRFQNRIQFFQSWMESKLTHGNTYALKERDGRGVVARLYILDPHGVKPLVSDSGDVFYELHRDNLARLGGENVIVPASEVIHDRWNTLYHPLVGLSPLYANGINALGGLKMAQSSAMFFANGGRPGGILTAPGAIADETAARLKAHWDANYSGERAGKVAVLGDGLKYEAMVMKSTDAQLVEQMRWTAETVCGVFGVPGYMVLTGSAPTYNNVEALALIYYSQCLHQHIESIEACLDEGLGLIDAGYGSEFDLSDLLRMDQATAARTEGELVKAGIGSPNESRLIFNRKPVDGGDTPYLQQQNFSLAALAKRDANDPFSKPEPDPAPTPEPSNDNEMDKALLVIAKGLA